MRIVKPHGTSETHFDDDGRIRRYVHPDSFPAEPVDPSVFAARHPKLVMAQWVSCIDKVVTRPHGEGLPSETQWALRNSLSKAAWDLIVEKGLLDAPAKRLKRFERQWWARIHPYGNETDPNTPRNPYGRWYRTLANGVEIADFNPETVANEIYVHLYENASRAHPEQEPRRSGLILERSDSIANSVPATTATGGGRLEPPWNATDIARYLEAGDIAASIRERLEKHHGQREAKLRHLCAAALADHLARLRCEVMDNDDGNRLPEGLFLLHEHVRRSYSDILKGTGIYADPAWENAQTIETRSLREFFRFGDHHLLAGELAQNPITLAQLQKLADVSAGVAPAQNRRSELHAEWVSNNRSLPDAKIDEYRALLGQIESIRHLSDHTELRDHLKLHSLLIDTLARLLDYAGQWERDLYFTTLALIHLAGSSPQELFQEQRGRYPIRTGQIIAALRSMRDTPGVDDIKVKLARIFEIDMPRVRGPNVQTRNELAHFNCLHAPADTIELTAMINRTRALMSYDRKQKNAVSKSVIELLDRNNVVLSWTYESGRLVEATVRPRVIRHLGHHELKERLVSTAFAEAVEGLFGSAKANTKHAQSLNARQPLW